MRIVACVLVFMMLVAMPARSQSVPTGGGAGNQLINVGGVAITPEGLLQVRRTAATPAARLREDPSLTYISLKNAFQALEPGKAPAKELRYLQGITRIDHLFVYPGDLVIAGSSEPIDERNALQPVGKISGRPALHVDDLVTVFRAFHGTQGAAPASFFGCSIDMTNDAQRIAADIGRRFANASRAQASAALKEALGPQTVRILGVPEDSRVALAMVAADYRLKRICIGAETLPLVGTGTSAALASNRVWLEPAYEALAVSGDGLNYRIAGPRLKVKAAAQQFDDRAPATPAAAAFAKRFSERMPEVAARIDAIADLQNIADLFLIAAIIRADKLEEKAGVNLMSILNVDKRAYQPAAVPVPRTAETLVADNGSAIIQGGVALQVRALSSVERVTDEKAADSRDRPKDAWFLTRAPAAK